MAYRKITTRFTDGRSISGDTYSLRSQVSSSSLSGTLLIFTAKVILTYYARTLTARMAHICRKYNLVSRSQVNRLNHVYQAAEKIVKLISDRRRYILI